MVPAALIASLEQTWGSFTHHPEAFRDEYGRFLHELLAASDDLAFAALLASPWLRARLTGLDWSAIGTPAETARLDRWLARVLAQLLSVSGTNQELAPFLASLRRHHHGSPALTPLLGECLRRRSLRETAASLLAHQDTPAAWALLRQHDSPDLDPDLRLRAALHDPARPGDALAAVLGPQADRDARARALARSFTFLGDTAARSELIDAILRCLDDGFEAAQILHTLARKDAPVARRRLFDRLWPVAQRLPRPPPWPGVDVFLLLDALVRTAPAPDLLAVLLDTLDDAVTAGALFTAIGQRPDPSLVTSLTRWSLAHGKEKSAQRLVERALKACRSAPPWSP